MARFVISITLRSIPAGAGEPSSCRTCRTSETVYPRGCGGTFACVDASSANVGLSPRVRGNQPALHAVRTGQGSIPAGAGEPRGALRRRIVGAVYPRGCGGTLAITNPSWCVVGLSPRVRGNRSQVPCRRAATWLTVYPRGCGGTLHRDPPHPMHLGLSPRVRGNPWRRTRSSGWSRSIPAGAGEPSGRIDARMATKVYPRGCGGTNSRVSTTIPHQGLSPRVRGNLHRAGYLTAYDRSIPAGAGEPCRPTPSPSPTRVYPRGCGGTSSMGSER